MEIPSDRNLSQKSASLKLFEMPSLLFKPENQSDSSLYNDKNKIKSFKEKLGWNPSENLDLLKDYFNLHYYFSNQVINKFALKKDYFNLHYYFSNQVINKFALTENNQILVSLSNHYYIYVYLLTEGKVIGILKFKYFISDFILIENSNEVLYYTATEVNLWNYKSDIVTKILDENSNQISIISVSSNNKKFAVGYDDGSIYLIEYKNNHLKVVFSYHKNKIYALTFSENNKNLISADGSINENPECKIGIWDIKNETLLVILIGHPFPIYTLKTDKTNKYLLSVSHDHTIRLWNLEQALLCHNSSEIIVNQKYKEFEYKSNALERLYSIKSKYRLKKLYAVDQIYYSEEWQMYGKSILSQFKDKFEVSRVFFPPDWFLIKSSKLEVFYENANVMVFNSKNASIEIYNIPNLHKQRVVCLSEIKIPKTICFISNEKLAVMDNNIFLYLINLTNQEENFYYLIGSSFSLYNFRIAKKKYLISLFSDINARIHTVSVVDLNTLRFLGHYFGDSQFISDAEISKNGQFLLLNTQSNVVKIINLEIQTIIGKINNDEYALKHFGFTSDSYYIATYQNISEKIIKTIVNDEENKETLLNIGCDFKGILLSFYEVENCKSLLIRKIINENSKIEIVKIRNKIYFSRPKERICNLCDTDEKNFNIKNGKIWACSKKKKYGVFPQNQLYSVFRLVESEICSFCDS
ncbi:hypothetical protein SteCoe_31273 [Stentor coeruleus]|uniref:Uncharacterized protein n=1 Tax=Stentor coeruleus TaxID=5963 RepID=A0A1R2B1W8_9CILI|nr:hypothetical protein SteCoe_31273 [Stentor coeruleus]